MSSEYSQEMGWRSFASSRLTSFRNRIAQSKNEQQTWRQWAGQKVAAAARMRSQPSWSSERVALFPGWAARRYQPGRSGVDDINPFEVDVFVSGYASSHRAPEFASRSQRAFMRMAKGYAALPKLATDLIEPQADPLKNASLSPSTEDLLKGINLPPTPDNDAEIEGLERQFEKQNSLIVRAPETSRPSSRNATNPEMLVVTGGDIPPTYTPSEIRRFHANLEARLQPFWSSILSSRNVRLRLYTSSHHAEKPVNQDELTTHTPVADVNVVTDQEGSFQARFRVQWEQMCQHPGGLHIAFGDPVEEHDLIVVADLLGVPNPQDPGTPTNEQVTVNMEAEVTATATLAVPITHSPIRVISDIDDTVKFSSILSGARSVFRNVFVKELSEAVIPGMGEWYTNMWARGIRFHYVSNGPFELLPVVNEFFQISRLPPGSIKLRSYAGRSIFNNLLSAPATRKRAGVEDILNAFPDSRFILIGDTGEQDLELYAEFAREKSEQILAVFLRDADDGYRPIDDPTGKDAALAIPPETPPRRNSRPYSTVVPSRRNTDSVIPTSNIANPVAASTTDQVVMALEPYRATRTPSPESSTAGGEVAERRSERRREIGKMSISEPRMNYATYREHPSYLRMSDVERKRCDLQMRVYRARVIFDAKIPLRVFRDPQECVEVWEILDRERCL